MNGKKQAEVTEELEVSEVKSGSEALEQITRGEVDIQIATAKKYPRSLEKFLKASKSMVIIDEDVAGQCFYKLPRGKDDEGNQKFVEGPGIRLAEIVANNWGNLRIASITIAERDEEVVVRGMVHDLETNVAVSQDEIGGIVYGKGRFAGQRYNRDMIIMTKRKSASIAIRNAVFRVIPRVYVDQLMKLAKETAVGTVATLPERRKKAIEYFAGLDVDSQRVFTAIGVNGLEEIDIKKLEALVGMKTVIEDGTSTVDELFPKPMKTEKPNLFTKGPEQEKK